MKCLSIFLCLFLFVGCNRVINVLDKAKETVGLGPTPEEVAAQKEREQQARELALQQLKDADALVVKWADKVQGPNTSGNGFVEHIEGLTDIDPWGNQFVWNIIRMVGMRSHRLNPQARMLFLGQ